MEESLTTLKKTKSILWNDLKSLKNIEIYFSIVITIVVSVLSFFGITNLKFVLGVLVATLGLFMSSLLNFKRKINSLEKSNKVIIPITQEINRRLSYSYDSSYIKFMQNMPDITDELKSAKVIKILSASLTSIATKYYDSFLKVLEQGGRIQIISCEPSEKVSSMQVLRTHIIKDASALTNQIIHYLKNLEGLKSFCSQKDNYHIKTIPMIIPYSIVLIENDNESKIYVKIMPYKTPGSEYPYFIIKLNENPDLYNFYLKQFDLMYEDSIDYL